MRIAIPLLALLLGCAPAMAQETPEARLREMLRRTAADLRASQDSQAALQASVEQEKLKSSALQKQVDQLTAAVAAPAKPSVSDEEIARMRADLQAARAQVTALEAGLKQWRDAYQKAAELARAKDAESRAATARAAESQRQTGICTTANTKLSGVANDILHLYQTQGFRSLLIYSYEPLLGLKKVELENVIQDYEDKILDQKYRPGRETAKIEAPK
jgi:microsomal dipeptidase-like Zn-dependent dipeptidase